jgi:rifampin ADP-ribosylating transferase
MVFDEAGNRRKDIRSAIRLEYLTVAWMAVEFGSSVTLGALSGSILLLAFGIDSLVEMASGFVVLRRFSREIGGEAKPERVRRAERIASRWTGYLLFALAAYVAASSAYGLIARHKQDSGISTWGLVVAVIAIFGMPLLARYKRRLAGRERLNSPSLRSDAAEAISCAYLAAVLLAGLLMTRLFGWWWMDSVAALALIPFIVAEGREAFEEEEEEEEEEASRNLSLQTFYHGTKARLKLGDLIEPGPSRGAGDLNDEASYVYVTDTFDAAIWGAELALGDGPGRIYIVEPTGPVMDDPNVTNQKFRGNPTRSYRSQKPLRVTGEVTDWEGHSPEVLKAMTDGIEEAKRLGIEPMD